MGAMRSHLRYCYYRDQEAAARASQSEPRKVKWAASCKKFPINCLSRCHTKRRMGALASFFWYDTDFLAIYCGRGFLNVGAMRSHLRYCYYRDQEASARASQSEPRKVKSLPSHGLA